MHSGLYNPVVFGLYNPEYTKGNFGKKNRAREERHKVEKVKLNVMRITRKLTKIKNEEKPTKFMFKILVFTCVLLALTHVITIYNNRFDH